MAQSSKRAWIEPCGFEDRASFCWLVSLSEANFAGFTGMFSMISFLVPRHIARSCSASVSKSRTATVAPSSTSAGNALTGCPPRFVSKTFVSVPIVQSVSPVRSRDGPEPSGPLVAAAAAWERA